MLKRMFYIWPADAPEDAHLSSAKECTKRVRCAVVVPLCVPGMIVGDTAIQLD